MNAASRHPAAYSLASPSAARCAAVDAGISASAGDGTSSGRMDLPSIVAGFGSPAIPRKVGAMSTCVAGWLQVEPGLIPGPRASR